MEATPIPAAAPGPPQQPGGDRERYRRRQRRRGIIAWSVLGLLVVAVGLAVAFGGNETHSEFDSSSLAGLFPAEMSSSQYERIHKGQGESEVLQEVAAPGEVESEVADAELLQLFPPQPSGSSCRFWGLSDAPGHLVRLCFTETGGSLEQKSVAAQGEDEAPHTLA